jgi:hypothetical protein
LAKKFSIRVQMRGQQHETIADWSEVDHWPRISAARIRWNRPLPQVLNRVAYFRGSRNTYYWLDPVKRVTGLIMSQIQPFADLQVLTLYGAFERSVYRAIPA